MRSEDLFEQPVKIWQTLQQFLRLQSLNCPCHYHEPIPAQVSLKPGPVQQQLFDGSQTPSKGCALVMASTGHCFESTYMIQELRNWVDFFGLITSSGDDNPNHGGVGLFNIRIAPSRNAAPFAVASGEEPQQEGHHRRSSITAAMNRRKTQQRKWTSRKSGHRKATDVLVWTNR